MPDQYSTCGNSLNSHVNNFHKYFKHEFHDELYEQLALSGQPTRSYLTIAAAIILAGVLISASLFVAVGGAKTSITTTTEMSVSTTTVTDTCSVASGFPPDVIFSFNVWVNYHGPWNATLNAYSGPALDFTQCYTGSGTGFVHLNNWNPNGSALLQVSAQKMDGSSGNLTLTVNGGTNSTVAPYGFVSVSVRLQR
jgi:hypothetical protein